MVRGLTLVLLLCSLGEPAVAATKKTRKPVPAPVAQVSTEAEIRKALDGPQDKVAECVVSQAPGGAWSLTVKLQMTITGAGQILALRLEFAPELAWAPKTRACIESVLGEVVFPKSGAPLVNVERDWTFKMQE